MKPPLLDQLRDVRDEYTRARAELVDLEHRRDDLIREAIDHGYPVVDIAAATGLSAPRIYQIRDRRR